MSPLFKAKALVYALGLVGVLGTCGRSFADGLLPLQTQAVDGPDPYFFPGTQFTLRKTFTGIQYPIDNTLSKLIVFWFEAVDGSHPAASAISFYFLGQLFPCIIITYLNALRGNRPSLVKPTLWLLLLQAFSIGATGFIYAIAYISASTTVQPDLSFEFLQYASLTSSPVLVWLLLPATAIGYFVTAFLMCLPSYPLTITPPLVSNTFQQIAMAVWNMYPVVILAVMYLARPALKPIISSTMLRKWPSSTTPASETKKKPATSPPSPVKVAATTHLQAVRVSSLLALTISSTMHLSTLGVSLATVLFPALFQPAYIKELSPASLFLPPVSLGPKVITAGDGVRSFLLWDQVACYSLFIVITAMELHSAVRARNRRAASTSPSPLLLPKMAGAAGFISLVLGPGSACLVGSWMRDEILFGGWSDGPVGDGEVGKKA
ncbi:hypothetical protein BJX76DRAFT_366925 [Aspergillus varians]